MNHIFELDGDRYDNCVVCGHKHSEVCHGVGKHPHKFVNTYKDNYKCIKCNVHVGGYERTSENVKFKFKKNKNGLYIMIYQGHSNPNAPFDKEMSFKCPIGPDEIMIKSIIE